jgi:translation initiation factor RLI1
MPFGVREGINIFLAGFIPTENLRFRDIGLTFKVAENVDEVMEQEKVQPPEHNIHRPLSPVSPPRSAAPLHEQLRRHD